MKNRLIRAAILAFVFTGAVLMGSNPQELLTAQIPSQKTNDNENKDRIIEPFGKVGVNQCRQCHVNGRVEDNAAQKEKLSRFITQKEYTTWKQKDLHANAFECLDNKLGRKMNENLGWKKDVKESSQCLVCHAVDMHKEKETERFYTDYGMSCEGCHGFAKEWNTPHSLPEWRKVSPEEKEKKGLVNLRNPHTRTEKCASCHIGNVAEGKVVTHEMFAAGHPPLVPLDVATFSLQEPAHGLLGRENQFLMDLADGKVDFNIFTETGKGKPQSPAEQKEIARKNYYYRENESKLVRDWLIGTLASLEVSVKLMGDEAKKAKESKSLLDFAHFDCYSCHHDLKVPSDRQLRGYDGVPGRPLMRASQRMLVQSILKTLDAHADGKSKWSETFQEQFAALNRAVLKGPFGNPKQISLAATQFQTTFFGPIYKELDTQKLDKILCEKLLLGIHAQILALSQDNKDPKNRGAVDYETAQLLTWAVKLLDEECAKMGCQNRPTKLQESLNRLQNPDGKSEPKLSIYLQKPGSVERLSIENQLPERLKILSNFQSLEFRKAFDPPTKGKE